jgi:hypothetical protein
MTATGLASPFRSAVDQYGVYWQVWQQFDASGGERELVGLEVELLGSHPSVASHVDPSCSQCQQVRSMLIAIANATLSQAVPKGNSFTRSIDSHSNSVLCLPAFGNRSAVSVSIYVYWNHANRQAAETELLRNIKTSLAEFGIHQR